MGSSFFRLGKIYMERNIIAINGTIGSGKDTFSGYFIENGYHRISFAESLKDAVSAIFGWDRDMLEGNTVESRKIREERDEYWSTKLGINITPRWVLQNLGTDILRKHLHDNIWIFSLERKIKNIENENIIITDCRFPNEIKMIRENHGIIIEVQRNIPIWYDDAIKYNLAKEKGLHNELIDLSLKYNIHSSEYGWVGINYPDYVIQNNGTVEDLQFKAASILYEIQK